MHCACLHAWRVVAGMLTAPASLTLTPRSPTSCFLAASGSASSWRARCCGGRAFSCWTRPPARSTRVRMPACRAMRKLSLLCARSARCFLEGAINQLPPVAITFKLTRDTKHIPGILHRV